MIEKVRIKWNKLKINKRIEKKKNYKGEKDNIIDRNWGEAGERYIKKLKWLN